MNTFTNAADHFEKWAADLQSVADSKPYRKNTSTRAAIMREVAHYLECAARLRGDPVPKLRVKRR